MNAKKIIAKLKAAGWFLARIDGSHPIFSKPGVALSVPVPMHGTKDLSEGLLSAIQRQTGVKLK